jgi:hypothetical protein
MERKKVIIVGDAPNARIFHVSKQGNVYEFLICEVTKDRCGSIIGCEYCAPYVEKPEFVNDELCGMLPSCTEPKYFLLKGAMVTERVMTGHWVPVSPSEYIPLLNGMIKEEEETNADD